MKIISLANHDIILLTEKKWIIILYRKYRSIITANANQELKGNFSGSYGHQDSGGG
jgi:hypothetical protein